MRERVPKRKGFERRTPFFAMTSVPDMQMWDSLRYLLKEKSPIVENISTKLCVKAVLDEDGKLIPGTERIVLLDPGFRDRKPRIVGVFWEPKKSK